MVKLFATINIRVIAIYICHRSEVAMDKIRNEAYVGVRQSSSDNDPSIPTTENEAYTSVTANTEPEDAYDYVKPMKAPRVLMPRWRCQSYIT